MIIYFNKFITLATDELRKEGSKFYTMHCSMEREKQLMDKQKKQLVDIEEEQIYAQLWKLDQLKKEERERIEAQEKKKLVNNTMSVLDWQKDTRSIIK